jgi:UDP-N-acetylmuramoyl-tripeptide--D-alanyl-D-alanine ligase
MNFTLAQVVDALNAAHCHAHLHHCTTEQAQQIQLHTLSTDSRKIAAGSMFLALRGEQFDAYDFVLSVQEAGAAVVVVERLHPELTIPAIVVENSLRALQEIAHFHRRQFTLPVIGVTGSNGKTTVKEMIASILRTHVGAAHSLATQGNLNNEIGVPLTILGLHAQHEFAVIELGMNHPGEIACIAKVAAPTVGLVNNAQREHQEFMQSVEAVAIENGSVITSLPEHGVAVFPAQDTYSALWTDLAQAHGARKICTFGLSPDADVSASAVSDAFSSQMQVCLRDQNRLENFSVNLAIAGQHNVLNALAAIACTYHVGISIANIVKGLEDFQAVKGRLQLKQSASGVKIIDDTYNANPDSVRAAIDVLAGIPNEKILVLGDMGEVGSDGRAFHHEIGEYARANGIQALFSLGDISQASTQSFAEAAQHFSSLEELLLALDGAVSPQHTVLVKGSRFMRMERVVEHLLQR